MLLKNELDTLVKIRGPWNRGRRGHDGHERREEAGQAQGHELYVYHLVLSFC